MSLFGRPDFRQFLDHRIAPPMWTYRPLKREGYEDEPHRPGLAECVCEEPCRYCKCEDKP